MLELQKQWEQMLQAAAGLFALLLIVTKGFNWFLLWMDSMDWIIIPNKEAMKNAESKYMQPWVEVQAVVEPAKRQVLKKKDDEVVKRDDDDEGAGDDH